MRKYLLFAAGLLLCLSACKKDDDPAPANENAYVNNWIYEQMQTNYLWNANLPKKPDYTLSPSDFFESLLYNSGQVSGDRFSWIQENYVELLSSLNGKSSYDVGFEYTGMLISQGSDSILAQVAYVKPNTNAISVGIKRGDYFTKVNGVQLTRNNWRSVFNSAGNVSITFVDPTVAGWRANGVSKTVSMMPNYAEQPIFLDTIYNEGANRVGYLVYNFFAGDDGSGNGTYNVKLNNVFGKFKAANITHLVLDLRYNSGGSMNSATLLGSMIVPQLNAGNIFTKVQYNDYVQSYLTQKYGSDVLIDKFKTTVAVSSTLSYPLNNVGNNLQGLYVLTGQWTASASELVINNLKPYLSTIFLIGTTTVGKNVGSVSIYEDNDPKNKWGMQPIVLKYFNRDGQADFLSGFAPNIVENDYGPKLQLGNRSERMLAIALAKINGTYNPASAERQHLPGMPMQVIGSSVERKAWANQAIFDFKKMK